MSNNILRIRALTGDDFETNGKLRRELLWRARQIRALRSWVREGCYAWWRLSDDLKRTQQEIRRELWP